MLSMILFSKKRIPLLPIVIICSLLACFVLLQLQNLRQITAIRQAVFVYSIADFESAEFAKQLNKSTPINTYVIENEKSEQFLKSIGIKEELMTPALILPTSKGPSVVNSGKLIQQLVSPLAGGATIFRLASITALAASAIWLVFTIYRRQVAYFGHVWPLIGLISLGIAVPNCSGCVGSSDFPWVPWVGIAAFSFVAFVLASVNLQKRWIVRLASSIGPCAAVLQLTLLLLEPKSCLYCIVAMAAAAGCYFTLSELLEMTTIRALSLPRWVSSAVTIAALLAGGRQFLAPDALASSTLSFHSTVGRNIREYVSNPKPFRHKTLVLVSLERCDSCENARDSLFTSRTPFEEIPYETMGNRSYAFRANFSRVAPLLLLCDSKGTILLAEAGWPNSQLGKDQLVHYYKRLLGGDHVH